MLARATFSDHHKEPLGNKQLQKYRCSYGNV